MEDLKVRTVVGRQNAQSENLVTLVKLTKVLFKTYQKLHQGEHRSSK